MSLLHTLAEHENTTVDIVDFIHSGCGLRIQ
jgi:hypothetical protein